MAFKLQSFRPQNKNGKFKEGQLVNQRIIQGKDSRYAVKLYYFKDGYKIYAWKEVSPNKIIESKATSYPISNYQEALKDLNSYKDEDDILVVHSALRSKA